MLLLFPIFLLLSLVDGQQNTPEQICRRFNSEPLKKASCEMTQQHIRKANAIADAGLVNKETPCASPGPGSPDSTDGRPSARAETPAATTPADLTESYKCMDIPCVCRGYGGTTNANNTCTVRRNGRDYTFGKAVRQECRTLSSTQWTNLVRAIQTLKWGPGENTYNRYVNDHNSASAPTAHGGPIFSCWHREFLKRYEMDLRRIDPSVSLCYWDSSMDDDLDDSRQSCIWTADFWGEARNNRVINGPYANWTIVEQEPLEREFGGPKGCISRDDVKAIRTYPLMEVMAFTTEYKSCKNPDRVKFNWPLEYAHGGPHNFIGGHMRYTDQSPNDPCFYHHHCFIDYLLESWRSYIRSQGNNPTTYYPESLIVDDQCASIEHSLKRQMLPFRDVTNGLSLSNGYLDNLYRYLPSPTCSRTRGCGSRYLFCCYNPAPTRCVAKIRIGGNCRKFSTTPTSSQTTLSAEETNPCYKSRCIRGICRATTSLIEQTEFQPAENELTSIILETRPKLPKVNISPFRVCYNYHECCPTWAREGHCTKSVFFMNIWCPASCKCDGCHERLAMATREAEVCQDIHPSCRKWLRKKRSECQANPRFMKSNCAKSCGYCNQRESVGGQCRGGPMAKGYYVSRNQLTKLAKLPGEPDED